MKKRARDLGLPFEGTPGEYNAITDVEGVEVGFSTIITGESTEDTTEDSDFARTGVTAILPSAVLFLQEDMTIMETEK